MSAILSFLLACVALAIIVGIGSVVLNIILTIGWLLIMSVVALISWLGRALDGWKHDDWNIKP